MNDYYEARQHLNLSQLAFDTIESDKFAFQEKPSFARIINRIFSTYRDYADASIENACSRFLEQLEKRVESIPNGPTKKDMLSALVESYKEELIKTVNSYPKERSFKFQLDRDNYEFIMDWKDSEGAYDGVPGRFIKAVLEEYARKPLLERESILFRDMIETINACIDSHLPLVITLNSGARFEVRPYGVLIDPGYNYHYLVGYSRRAGEKREDKPSSFRLSNIREYKLYYGRSGKITAAQTHEINKKINDDGVQFLLQDSQPITVRLTEIGKRMYDSQMHLRPLYSDFKKLSDGSWLFTFDCTQMQAEFYFFKFGVDAIIENPIELKEKFLTKYQVALTAYQQ